MAYPQTRVSIADVHKSAKAVTALTMPPVIRNLVRSLASSLPIRFLSDFWYSPRAAVRRYSKRRTWPTSDELDRMSPDQFEAHMRSIGMLSAPPEAGELDESSRRVLTGIPVGHRGRSRAGTASQEA